MIRALYRGLLRLHPESFREQYAAEMLWIFDEAAAAEGAFPLFLDGCVSVTRQWVLRSGAWKMAAGGCVSFFILGGMLGANIVGPRTHARLLAPPVEPAAFRGHWAGNFEWPAPAGQMELTLSEQGNAWGGEFAVRSPDGVLHRGQPEDIRFEGNSIRFRVQTAYGPMTFSGKMIEGKLSGALQPASSAPTR